MSAWASLSRVARSAWAAADEAVKSRSAAAKQLQSEVMQAF
jgi:hypothetical protein